MLKEWLWLEKEQGNAQGKRVPRYGARKVVGWMNCFKVD